MANRFPQRVQRFCVVLGVAASAACSEPPSGFVPSVGWKPVENAYVESFHDKMRAECLDQHWFTNLHDARDIISAWQDDYNSVRPHSALQQLTPNEYARTFTRSPQPSAYTS